MATAVGTLTDFVTKDERIQILGGAFEVRWNYDPDKDQRGFLNIYTANGQTNVLSLWVTAGGAGDASMKSFSVSLLTVIKGYEMLIPALVDTLVSIYEQLSCTSFRTYGDQTGLLNQILDKNADDSVSIPDREYPQNELNTLMTIY